MARSYETHLAEVRSRVNRLLHDDVIPDTIVVMRELQAAMSQLALFVAGQADTLIAEEKKELESILLPLVSESIREALHKNELYITNGIIRSKNRILIAIGARIPEGHEEIDPRAFPNYSWWGPDHLSTRPSSSSSRRTAAMLDAMVLCWSSRRSQLHSPAMTPVRSSAWARRSSSSEKGRCAR